MEMIMIALQLNWDCVRQGIVLGLALGGTVSRVSSFDRKHYFYCDSPHGFQITQHWRPLVEGGQLQVLPGLEVVKIERVQLEMDTGRSLHGSAGNGTLVDLNRAGCALAEIVTAPCLVGPGASQMASRFIRTLQMLLRATGVSDANMEEGSLRCDANISVRPVGSTALGVRTEVKNLNSPRHVERAIEYEASRQVSALESGEQVRRETRGWDVGKGETFVTRVKETTDDYRFLPDGDLPDLIVTDADLAEARTLLGSPTREIPAAALLRAESAYGLPRESVYQLLSEPGAFSFFEEAMASVASLSPLSPAPSSVFQWTRGELAGRLAPLGLTFRESPVRPPALAELVALLSAREISAPVAKTLLDDMVAGKVGNLTPRQLVKDRGLQVAAFGADSRSLCDQILANHPSEVAKYRAGSDRVMRFFVAEVMKASKGKADPVQAASYLKQKLSQA